MYINTKNTYEKITYMYIFISKNVAEFSKKNSELKKCPLVKCLDTAE